jgi:transposase
MNRYARVNIYFMDESRFGLMTIQRSVLTLKGVKPWLPYQHQFDNFYLFGAYSAITGHHFTLELPQCNTQCFQLYLQQFSKQSPDEFKIVILDNGAFHHSKALCIPDNIALVFLPPYCPELNPAEKIWRHLKNALANTLFKTLDNLSDKLQSLIQQLLTPQTISSLTRSHFYIHHFHNIF